ncbi:MAG: histidine phosphatase family protein [Candidatus Binataceae bacterium]
MGKLILVRHGESEGNRIRHFTNSPDAAITELGRQQAREAALRIKTSFHPRKVIASPYFRTRETARIIAEQFDLPVEIEPEFREQNLGAVAGKPYEVVRADPSFDPAHSWQWRPPGGESHLDVRRRSAPVLDRIARDCPDCEVVIVSHGGVMRALWAHVTGGWEGAHIPANCGIIVIEHDAGHFALPTVIGGAQDEAAREAGA